MYEKFFGFTERPFQLVPNPAYLFLSKSHEDVLAHLTYAVSQGDGFVEITGEVGTGKTTLCRVFLSNLEEKAEAAYIFNPMLNAVQLLKTINQEFGIDAAPESAKDLIDSLNLFLMERKRQGKQAILLIDEAQNLNKDVLEQLRLLSNLETDTSKLLQIILVGQPELRDILDSHELRQLRQRITLSCHLRPLNLNETRDYIRHRIQIAARKPSLKFTQDAFRTIFRYSRGIPRLINIVCDRALLTAYGLDQHKITGRVTAAAIQEISSRSSRRTKPAWIRWPLYATALLCIGLIAAAPYIDRQFGILARIRQTVLGGPAQLSGPPPEAIPNPEEPLVPETPGPAAKQVDTRFGPAHLPSELSSLPPEFAATAPSATAGEAPTASALPPGDNPDPGLQTPPHGEPQPDGSSSPDRQITDAVGTMDRPGSRRRAFEAALALWQPQAAAASPDLDRIDDPETFFRLAAAREGYSLFAVNHNLSLSIIRRLNLPVILECRAAEEGDPAFLPLVHIRGNDILIFKDGGEALAGNWDQLAQLWTGRAYILWKNFRGLSGVIPVNTSDASVMTLKMILREIGHEEIRLTPDFDAQTRDAVKAVQARHGLPVDGYAGPLTLIALYNEMSPADIPRLEAGNRHDGEETAN
ncbi:AAA family ATPase [Desulfococcus sp.]|uniref:AAA family ATPase n=1 Tax=Desulfococcus sp. TaxID=2025834 RepID=UPI0035936FA7